MMIKFAILALLIVTNYAMSQNIQLEKDSNIAAFLALPFTEEDRNTSKEIINNTLGLDLDVLLDDLSIIEQAREKIEKISILKLLAFAFSDSESFAVIKKVSSDEIKKHFFIAWISLLFNDLKGTDSLFNQKLLGFSEFLSLDIDVELLYLSQNNYPEFIAFLLSRDMKCNFPEDILLSSI